jgi:hypothetical protein
MKMLKKLVRGGAIASSKKMAPAVGGVAAAKTAQPMVAQAATMPPKAPLSNLRSSVKSMAANVKTAVAKQPALQKAVASQANKPVGRLVGGLSSKFLKRR